MKKYELFKLNGEDFVVSIMLETDLIEENLYWETEEPQATCRKSVVEKTGTEIKWRGILENSYSRWLYTYVFQ